MPRRAGVRWLTEGEELAGREVRSVLPVRGCLRTRLRSSLLVRRLLRRLRGDRLHALVCRREGRVGPDLWRVLAMQVR